jgi:hypothetical protein
MADSSRQRVARADGRTITIIQRPDGLGAVTTYLLLGGHGNVAECAKFASELHHAAAVEHGVYMRDVETAL